MTPADWPHRGDFLFTTGSGAVSWVIRHGSASHWSHCGQVIDVLEVRVVSVCELEGTVCAHAGGECLRLGVKLHTVEAFEKGLRHYHRWVVACNDDERHRFLFLRAHRTEVEADTMVAATEHLASIATGYDWYEIGRIAARQFGVKVSPTDRFPTRFICSAATALAAGAGRPELVALSPHPLDAVWPGLVRELLPQLDGAREVRGWLPVGELVPVEPEVRLLDQLASDLGWDAGEVSTGEGGAS